MAYLNRMLAGLALAFSVVSTGSAAVYSATPSNYLSLLSGLQPGDTLSLAPGTYSLLPIYNLRGTSSAWITITGPATGSPARITGTSTSNTVEIYNCSYVAIQNLTIDSLSIPGVFGVSAKDGTSNLTHDILIQDNTFVGQDGGQQTVSISTKTPTWGWVIRGNTINGAGTGMYLGDSDGTQPFVAGIIENNLVENTIGYNIQVKWQLPRPAVAGMPTGPSQTIIRNNVFIKNDQASPDGDRPNLLVGGFPDSGAGSLDLYDICGNFFYHNPRETLFQGSGRVSVHDNVFVDSYAPAIVLENQDLALKVGYVYNNTIYTQNRGIFFGSTATVDDMVTGNLVFAGTPISGSIAHSSNNATDAFASAGLYVNAPSFTLGSMDFYPRIGAAQGPALDLSKFVGDTGYSVDFNGTSKTAAKGAVVYRGAYAGDGINPGWTLQAAIKVSGGTATPPAPVVTSVTCSPTTLSGGQTSNCTASLSGAVSAASAIGLSSNSAALSTPASVAVASGGTSATFVVTAATVASTQSAVVTASFNGATASASLTVNPPPPSTPPGGQKFYLKSDATEVSGTGNGSVITPSVGPSGFTGTVVQNGSGSVNFAPGQSGNGVYFLNCCVNTNNAYYKFTGAAVGNIFNASQGQVTFYLKSRYTWAQRQSSASTVRVAFHVRDGSGTDQLYFDMQPVSGYLALVSKVWGTVQYYYVPQGTEDTLYGSGVVMKVGLSWSGGTAKLYLNDELATTFAYTSATPNWSAASNLDVGGYEYGSYGGYYTLDDIIDEFTVFAGGTTTSAPTVSLTAPASGAQVSRTITVSGNATSTVGMSSVQFKLDGANLGSVVTGSGPGYSTTWNTAGTANGTHILTAVATDTAGNSTTSAGVSVTVNNAAAPPSGASLLLHLDASEVSGTTNGSVITPSASPTGFTGSVVQNGSGSVNFAPGQSGNGVFFLNCCVNSNNAYYKFTGTAIGNIFNASQGQATFYLKSRYTWAQRQASATGVRVAFHARDGSGTDQMYFDLQVVGGRLVLVSNVWGAVQYYYVPQGDEDTVYGAGVAMKVALWWNAGTAKLYLNDTLATSWTYTPAVPNWSAASNLDIGGYEYGSYGGYDALDDIIDEFSVLPAAQ